MKRVAREFTLLSAQRTTTHKIRNLRFKGTQCNGSVHQPIWMGQKPHDHILSPLSCGFEFS